MTLKSPLSIPFRSTIVFLTLLCLSFSTIAQKNKPISAGPDIAILSDSATLTKGDYLVQLQKVFETVNKVPVTVASFTKLKPIANHLVRNEAVLSLLKSKLTQTDRTPNLQNLQMDQTLLEELQANNEECLADLDEYEKELRALKTEILSFRKDTILTKLFTLPSMRVMFKSEFEELKEKGQVMDSLLKSATLTINDLQARTSSNLINIKELIYLTDGHLDAVSIKAFGKERRYLWEPTKRRSRGLGFQKFINGEKEISGYYFEYTRSSRMMLLLTCLTFFFWVFINFRSMKQRDRLEALDDFSFCAQSPFCLPLSCCLPLRRSSTFVHRHFI